MNKEIVDIAVLRAQKEHDLVVLWGDIQFSRAYETNLEGYVKKVKQAKNEEELNKYYNVAKALILCNNNEDLGSLNALFALGLSQKQVFDIMWKNQVDPNTILWAYLYAEQSYEAWTNPDAQKLQEEEEQIIQY